MPLINMVVHSVNIITVNDAEYIDSTPGLFERRPEFLLIEETIINIQPLLIAVLNVSNCLLIGFFRMLRYIHSGENSL
jgi:hypothetical protein